MAQLKAGDWLCPGCGAHNFASRSSCMSCQASKPAASSASRQFQGAPRGRPGDWTCPGCNGLVFASKSQCGKCGSKKPGSNWSPAQAKAPLPGDWNCPNCKEVVFRGKPKCFKCGAPKPGQGPPPSSAPPHPPPCAPPHSGSHCPPSAPPPAGPQFPPPSAPPPPTANGMDLDQDAPTAKPGDWKCPCGEVNFKARAACWTCKAPKGGQPSRGNGPPPAAGGPAPPRPGDWNCKCGEMNFGSRLACRGCGEARPNTGKVVEAKAGLFKLPAYWKLCAAPDPALGFGVEPVTDRTVWSGLEAALKSTHVGSGGSNIRIKRVLRIENFRLLKSYMMKREEVADMTRGFNAKTGKPGVQQLSPSTWAGHAGVPGGQQLHKESNEFYLFHGTTKAVAEIIAQQGFDERVASLGGLYGAGVYFAENSSKSLGYASPDPATKERAMLYCRVTLGAISYTSTHQNLRRPPGRPEDPATLFNSVVTTKGSSPREFIIYDRGQAYPEYLIFLTN